MLGLFAGTGRLPHLLAQRLAATGRPFAVVHLEGHRPEGLGDVPHVAFRVERLSRLFDRLGELGVREACFAGAAQRPELALTAINVASAPLVARVGAALSKGDDGLLRVAVALLEERGIAVVGAHVIAPDLLPPAGVLTGRVGRGLRSDAARAESVLDALAPVDVGQGCVVSRGRVLAIEALPGTDWMLGSLAADRRGPPGGLLMKAPKAGQDRRVDLPAIGPSTVAACRRADLAAIVIEAGGVMVLDRDETVAAARDAGLTLWVRRRGG
ncbi:LpxI family protein [Rhodobacteraceae bacterium CCMM004]|nr:LpxI family protein [Rhodobacteraceae bacterium CCMM004]